MQHPMIQPIVEGYGEVAAVPILLRRLAEQMQVHSVHLGRPIRRSRTQMLREDDMRKYLELSRKQGCKAVLVLFDADDLCTQSEANKIQDQASRLAGALPGQIVAANREYEGWFLAGLKSLHPDGQSYPGDPDQKRGAKEEFERQMQIRYNAPADQPRYTNSADLALIHLHSRSFRKMTKAYFHLLHALDYRPVPWPGAS
jgi:hypothetical protein